MAETGLIPGAVGAGSCQCYLGRLVQTAGTGTTLFPTGVIQAQVQGCELLPLGHGNR